LCPKTAPTSRGYNIETISQVLTRKFTTATGCTGSEFIPMHAFAVGYIFRIEPHIDEIAISHIANDMFVRDALVAV
jgi:hypothetical protein